MVLSACETARGSIDYAEGVGGRCRPSTAGAREGRPQYRNRRHYFDGLITVIADGLSLLCSCLPGCRFRLVGVAVDWPLLSVEW